MAESKDSSSISIGGTLFKGVSFLVICACILIVQWMGSLYEVRTTKVYAYSPNRHGVAVDDLGYFSHLEDIEKSKKAKIPKAKIPETKVMDSSCAKWNCTCQGMSNYFGISHHKSYGHTNHEHKVWWREHHCSTTIPRGKVPEIELEGHKTTLQSVNGEIDCSDWNCTCQDLSEKYYANHHAKTMALSPHSAKVWWREHKCRTHPKHLFKLRPKLKDIEPSKLASADSVCYFIPTQSGTERRKGLESSWGRDISDRLYFIYSEDEDTVSKVDFEKMEVRVAKRKYIDSEGKYVEKYDDPDYVGRWGQLSAKMMKFWEYLSYNFDDVWASRCAWFVRTDDDTWLNSHIVKQRLSCADPDKEISLGFTNRVWGIGIYSGYSRVMVRNMAFYLRSFRNWAGAEYMYADCDDRRLGQIVGSFGLGTVELVAHNGSDYYDKIDGHTTDTHIWEHQEKFAKEISVSKIGCMSFFHSARPNVMKSLSSTLEKHLDEYNGTACPKNWKKQGVHPWLAEVMEMKCPGS